jgi:hypothetical protein
MSVWSSAGAGSGAFYKPRQTRKRGIIRTTLGMAATVAAMAGLASVLLDPPGFIVEQVARPAVETRPQWVEIVKPFQLYTISSSVFGNDPGRFSARRHTGDGGRIDALTYGAAEPGRGNWLRVEIHRHDAIVEAPIPFYAEIARQAGRANASLGKTGLPALVATRFGQFEMADVQVVIEDRHNACTGFRVSHAEPGLSIAGIACGTSARPLDRATVACALERLDLVSAGDDRKLGDFFAAAELKRSECSASRNVKALDRPGWLDPVAAAVPLKGSLASAQTRRR